MPDIIPQTKTCITCHQTKPLSQFTPDKQNKDGHKGQCHECRVIYQTAYYKAHKDEINQRAREKRHKQHQPQQKCIYPQPNYFKPTSTRHALDNYLNYLNEKE